MFGLRLTRTKNDVAHQIVKGLAENRIDLVFDVGANVGQFARSLRQAGFSGRIVCFEPLPEAHRTLQHAFKRDDKTIVHKRIALGDRRDSLQINVSENSVSSSLLTLLPSHSDAAPDSVYVDTVETDVQPLDDVFGEYASAENRVFLKIDTQGYEWNVLDGARQCLRQIDGLLLEMSMVPLYEGQRLWKEILDRLERDGFVLWQVHPGFSDPAGGRMLQFDGVFYRDGLRDVVSTVHPPAARHSR